MNWRPATGYWRLPLAWLIRLLIFLPGALFMLLAMCANELDMWSSEIILRHRRERDQSRREELMSPEWPWT